MQDLVPEEGNARLDNQMVVKKGLERDMDKEQPQNYGAEARDRAQKVWVMYQVSVVSKLESKLGEEMHSCTPRRLAAQAPSLCQAGAKEQWQQMSSG